MGKQANYECMRTEEEQKGKTTLTACVHVCVRQTEARSQMT